MKRGLLAAICLTAGLVLAVVLAPAITPGVPVAVPVTMNAAETMVTPLRPGVEPPATGGGNGQY